MVALSNFIKGGKSELRRIECLLMGGACNITGMASATESKLPNQD